jgi:hypothetical protein
MTPERATDQWPAENLAFVLAQSKAYADYRNCRSGLDDPAARKLSSRAKRRVVERTAIALSVSPVAKQ